MRANLLLQLRADMRCIGRQLWKTLEKTLLSGGRDGTDRALLKKHLLTTVGTTSLP